MYSITFCIGLAKNEQSLYPDLALEKTIAERSGAMREGP